MEQRDKFRVRCSTNTYTDVLVTLGLAKTLGILSEGEVYISREHGEYVLRTESPIGDMSTKVYMPLFDTIRAKGEVDNGQTRDYESLKVQRDRYFKMPKELRKSNELPEGINPPSPDYSLMSSLIDLLKPMAKSTYSKTAQILKQGAFGLYLEGSLKTFSEFDSDPNQTLRWLKAQIGKQKIELQTPVVMIFNPMSGKGMNSDKPNSIDMGRRKAPISFEMLKFSGWWVGAIAKTPTETKDLKILVVVPQEITLIDLNSLMYRLRSKTLYSRGAVQIDIITSLEMTIELLKYHEEKQIFLENPRQVIQGFYTAYFKNLGTSKGVSNLSFIGLPEWVHVENDDDRGLWLRILQEHSGILSRLDESRSETHNLLELYRDFLSNNSLEQFLEFLVDYGAFALAQMARDKFVLIFQSQFIDRVIRGWRISMNQEKRFAKILENQGFRNIATAIRYSTFGALNAQKRHNNRTFEVHFGLAQQLKRHTHSSQDFLQALSDFVNQYMTENLRASYRDKHLRQFVTTDDLQQMVALVDEFDSRTVGMLLIAYGYSRDEKDKANLILEPKIDDFDEVDPDNIEDDFNENGDDN
jgi:uncharacterized protein (UPF0332 family)